MISIAVHVLLVLVLSSLLERRTRPSTAKRPRHASAATVEAAEPPPEEDDPAEPEETEQVHQTDVVAKEPTIKDAELVRPRRDRQRHAVPRSRSARRRPLRRPVRGPGRTTASSASAAARAARSRAAAVAPQPARGRPAARRPTTRSLHALRGSRRTSRRTAAGSARASTSGATASPTPGERPDGPGKAMYDVGRHGPRAAARSSAPATRTAATTSSPRSCARACAYLKNVQDPEGCFGPRATQHYIYNHAIAALAMVEAYGMTESPIFKGSAQKALDFIALVAQPVLRVALRREARRQRHLGHGLDDDGAQERAARSTTDAQARGKAAAARRSTRRPSTASGRGSTR